MSALTPHDVETDSIPREERALIADSVISRTVLRLTYARCVCVCVCRNDDPRQMRAGTAGNARIPRAYERAKWHGENFGETLPGTRPRIKRSSLLSRERFNSLRKVHAERRLDSERTVSPITGERSATQSRYSSETTR